MIQVVSAQLRFHLLQRKAATCSGMSSSSSASIQRRVLVPIANGSEDIETACISDVLRRAGYHVDIASVEAGQQVTLARGMRLTTDILIEEAAGKDYDLIALPGGMPGAEHLRDSAPLTSLLMAQHEAGKWIAAVCASPAVVFATHGLLKGAASATCHPNFMSKLTVSASEARVVVDKNIITSRGPGTSIEFALQCIACLDGKEKALEVARPMVLHDIELK